MMNEIFQRGPIVCSIAADDELVYSYRGGVYRGANATDVDHDVEVTGWGVEEATGAKYWHVRNSWGSFWGELGFVKIQRGNNHLSLEACDCWYGNPTWETETEILDGARAGTMAGTVPAAARRAAPRAPAAAAAVAAAPVPPELSSWEAGERAHLQGVRALLRAHA